MSRFLTLDDFNFKDKVVLVRVDFNSPLDPKTKEILDDTRIRRHGRTTIRELSEGGAKVVILAHQGRPGEPDFTTLKKHSEVLGRVLNKRVKYVDSIFDERARDAVKGLKSGEILVLENVRMFPEEMVKKKPEEHAESELVKNLAPLADIYVNDAFAAAHRSHASLVGFPAVLPTAAGRVMEAELKALSKVTGETEKPCVYILGGAKAEDSAAISEHVLTTGTATSVLTGGVVANLFLYAKGYDLGKPNVTYLEGKGFTQLVPKIKALFERFDDKILVPEDLAIEVEGKRKEISTSDLPTEHPIYDIGPKTVEKYASIIKNAKTIVLNGPVGVFENDEFLSGTKGVFEAVARSKAYSVAGGGHTVAAIKKLGVEGGISYISTGGGALMRYLMGKKLPVIEALEKAYKRRT